MMCKVKTISYGLAIIILLSVPATAADNMQIPPLPDTLDMGVRAVMSDNDSQLVANYQEVILLTGEPILAAGTLTIRKGRPRDNKMSTTYNYDLQNKNYDVKLTRRLTVTTSWQVQGKGITAQNEVDRFTETVRIGARQYTLDGKRSMLEFSDVTMCEPAVSYFAGNAEGRKLYTVGRNEGQVTVEISSTSTGYNQPWGRVEIQDVYGIINSELTDSVAGSVSWTGTFNSQISHSMKSELKYLPNEPMQISFAGGFVQTENSEGIMKMSYDLPRLDEQGLPSGSRRRREERTINLTGAPKVERLAVPQYSDIRGRWSELDAILLGSLGAWPGEQRYFHPGATVSRREFAFATAKALRLQPEEPAVRGSSSRQMLSADKPYRDLSSEDADWPYLEQIISRGVMQGVAPDYFGPEGKMTRAQAVTAFVRALGFEHLSLGSSYQTGFSDDADIPAWARDHFAVASQIGLISGDAFGRARPGAYLTREEAASMLARLITYLRSDILRDYRDRILLYG